MRFRLPKPTRFARLLLLTALLMSVCCALLFADDGSGAAGGFYGTVWSLLPPIVAIVLALITKEVYISLFVGILSGGLLAANFNPFQTMVQVTEVMTAQIADEWNAGVLIFLAVLGILVALMNAAGGSAAYGRWASSRIKSAKGAQLSTMLLGLIIFVDDYFNCLTVGSVMTPVTDKEKVSRAKLSYIIDATAAPVCIIAPISSWAAAVTSSVTGDDLDGFKVFLQAIPYNYYALLTILFMFLIIFLRVDFGPMKRAQAITDKTGDLFSGTPDEYGSAKEAKGGNKSKGILLDLVFPVAVLIVLCITGMVYTGGFFDGVDFITAFSDADASVGLALGSIVTLVIVFVYYMCRRALTFKQFAGSLTEGVKQMVPAILILTFAWTLSGFCRGSLGAGDFVEGLMQGAGSWMLALVPLIMFLIACGMSFATGTSWGTFGILIPIAQSVIPTSNMTLLVITISSCMAGAVFGDHCSPISDTTIMASAGARVNHILHVTTQAPYAITVAVVSAICYVVVGFVQNAVVGLAVGVVLLTGTVLLLKKRQDGSASA